MRPEPPRPVAPDNRGPATAVLVAALAVGLAAPSSAAVTTYRYDPLGNLVEVRQEAPGDEIQIRQLEHDGFSRLIRETHPESGTSLYRYDRVGNLVEKRDARGVNTHLAYDALNRPLSKSFSPSATYPESFAYEYDQPVTNGIGRLFRVRELRGGTVEGESLYFYDELGRVIREERRTFGIHAAAQYTYNAAGARTRILWPASLNQPDTADLFRTFEYDDQLRTTRVVFGAGVDPGTLLVDGHTFELTSTGATESTWVLTDQRRYRETLTYNLRFQPIRHRVVDESSNQTLLDLAYDYGGVQNNSSLRARTDNLRPRFSLTFSYDGVDRLTRTDHSGSLLSDPWHVRYVYDRFGNRTDTPIGGAPPNGFNPLENITYTGNRSDTWLYDAAGSQIGNNLTDPPIATWDGDNRLTQVRNTAQGVASYFYDSEGRRVRKTTSSGTRTYFRDPGGDVLLEWLGESDADRAPDVARVFAGGKLRFTWNAADPAPGGTHVVFPDYLGSPVLKIDWDTDAVLADAYYPFGQQLNAPADAYHSHRFTGQERDAETGLVYFGARYYQDAAARFVSVDPSRSSADPGEPQSWNRYAYTLNNPLKFVDPDGRETEKPAPPSTFERLVNLGRAAGIGLHYAIKEGARALADGSAINFLEGAHRGFARRLGSSGVMEKTGPGAAAPTGPSSHRADGKLTIRNLIYFEAGALVGNSVAGTISQVELAGVFGRHMQRSLQFMMTGEEVGLDDLTGRELLLIGAAHFVEDTVRVVVENIVNFLNRTIYGEDDEEPETQQPQQEENQQDRPANG